VDKLAHLFQMPAAYWCWEVCIQLCGYCGAPIAPTG